MAIDYVIDYACEPKQQLTTPTILSRLKGRDQARRIIKLYRDAGDNRPYEQMGFEFTRATADGGEETEIVMVNDLIEDAKTLDQYAEHCVGCPANRTGAPYGCFNKVPYPISDHGERWLLMRLPLPPEAVLVWTLLGENLREINQSDATVQEIRETGTYFESERNPRRRLGEIALSGNNVFFLLFMGGHIPPARAAVLMLFFGVISQNIDAPTMYKLTPAPADAETRHPYQLKPEPETDDGTITSLKAFFDALYTAWRLNVDLLVDA